MINNIPHDRSTFLLDSHSIELLVQRVNVAKAILERKLMYERCTRGRGKSLCYRLRGKSDINA